MSLRLRILAFVCCAAFFLGPACGALGEEPQIRGYVQRQGWQYVTLGRYHQAEDGGVEPIIWRVLSVEGSRAYVVSEYVLINHRIHPDDTEYIAFGGDFRQTEMWDFLNGAFAQEAFSEAELNVLEDTEDFGRLFLLSREDLKNKSYGFISNNTRKAWGTPWALAQMTYNEEHHRAEQALFRYSAARGSHSPYWTRTQGSNGYSANCTKSKGEIGWIRVVVQNEGCRPACVILLDQVMIAGGSGALDDPWILVPQEAVEVSAEPITATDAAQEGAGDP